MTRVVLFGILFVVVVAAANGATIEPRPENSVVGLDKAFSIEIKGLFFVDGTETPIETLGGGVDVFFDPSVLEVTKVTVNSADFTFKAEYKSIDNTNGQVDSILVSQLGTPFPGGEFNIATVEFRTVATGTSFINLGPSILGPSVDPAPWLEPDGTDIDPAYVSVNDAVTVVPLPAAAWLFLGALGGFGLLRRRPASARQESTS